MKESCHINPDSGDLLDPLEKLLSRSIRSKSADNHSWSNSVQHSCDPAGHKNPNVRPQRPMIPEGTIDIQRSILMDAAIAAARSEDIISLHPTTWDSLAAAQSPIGLGQEWCQYQIVEHDCDILVSQSQSFGSIGISVCRDPENILEGGAAISLPDGKVLGTILQGECEFEVPHDYKGFILCTRFLGILRIQTVDYSNGKENE